MNIKFIYDKLPYPRIYAEENGFQICDVIYPNIFGTFDLARIDSNGKFYIVAELNPEDIKVVIKE